MASAAAEFYVYVLADPRNHRIFYIGKGKGRRAWQHEKDVRKGTGHNQVKAEVIADIHAARESVRVRIIKARMTEDDAYGLERALIGRHHARLTNISLGSIGPVESIRAAARNSLRRVKTLCELLDEMPIPDQNRAARWVQIVTHLAQQARWHPVDGLHASHPMLLNGFAALSRRRHAASGISVGRMPYCRMYPRSYDGLPITPIFATVTCARANYRPT